MHPVEQILSSVEPLLENIFIGTKADGIDLSSYIIDHICYRTDSIERYSELSKILSSHGVCIGEYIISGRPIATFLLNTPMEYRWFKIECIELPAPKSGKQYSEGWEHAECFMGTHPQDFMNKYPDVIFNTDSIEKLINPEIERKYGQYTLKFHEHTLRYVVEVLQA